jgi:dienelactone hydrolase
MKTTERNGITPIAAHTQRGVSFFFRVHSRVSRALAFLLPLACTFAAEPPNASRANRVLADYFSRQVANIESHPLAEPTSAEQWEKTRAELRGELAEMLGLAPMPERTPLKVEKTGEVKGDGFVVEKMHYEASPGLYVTANLYRPEKSEGRLPAILYVCGHAVVVKDGVSLGNKAGYQHHGEWFARHGYVCLTIDTVELGEIRGEHHGTFSKGRWWWFSRGYTPAGIETWFGIRGLDYLVSRPDVDPERIGVTGRSGGGAYSWYIAALDERVKVAAPTAGITTLHNHVVDGTVEGHCDCMFFVNTYRWDFDKVAALIAPRPLLICNTDKDTIFPLDGVVSIYNSTRRIYRALGAEAKIGLQISEGPHKDTQPLNEGAFHWFERWLKNADPMAVLDEGATKRLEPEQLRVFSELPKDERNTRIDAEFVPAAHAPEVPADAEQWAKQRDSWMAALREKCFAGWPNAVPFLDLRDAGTAEHDGVVLHAWDFTPQQPWTLRLYVAHHADVKPEDLELVALNVLDDEAWGDFRQMMAGNFPKLFLPAERAGADGHGFSDEKKMFDGSKWAMAYVCPRGVGPTAWTGSDKQQTQRLRRFYLLGQTLDSMQVWDIRRAIAALRATPYAKAPLWLQSQHTMAGNTLYASLFEEKITRLDLHRIPASHTNGPTFLNVLKYLDTPQAAAIAAERSRVRIYTAEKSAWSFPAQVAEKLGWKKAFELRDPLAPLQ